MGIETPETRVVTEGFRYVDAFLSERATTSWRLATWGTTAGEVTSLEWSDSSTWRLRAHVGF